MHQFLPAVGFSKLKKEELEELLYSMVRCPDYQESAIDSEGNQFVEMRYFVGKDMGIVLRGTYDENDEFKLDYYYPTYFGENISSEADVEIIKQSDKESYQVVCDESKLGVNLIFFLQNMGEYLIESQNKESGNTKGIRLAGLSGDGKIILPVLNNIGSKEKSKINQKRRADLVDAARDGDERAMESLTIEDMDTYAKISRRIANEDILSIVSSYFMPFGIENDKYSILGEILDYKKITNHLTMEECYILTVNCNEIILDVCINSANLFGAPEVGRRFKGNIWLQGSVDFE